MHPLWFGDSFDIVKRFFCGRLHALGYDVFIDAMFTDDAGAMEEEFYRFLGVRRATEWKDGGGLAALLLDPDTGISGQASPKHVTISEIADRAGTFDLVLVFDQSFSRQHDPVARMQAKLAELRSKGIHGMYYDSHAKFLFASRKGELLQRFRTELLGTGMPARRLLSSAGE
jgi:hypothetical protein